MITPEEQAQIDADMARVTRGDRALQARIDADMARAKRGLAQMNRARRRRLWAWAVGGAVLGSITGLIADVMLP